MDDLNGADLMRDFARLRIDRRVANDAAVSHLKIISSDVGKEEVITHLRQHGHGLKSLTIQWPDEGQHLELLAMVTEHCPTLETFDMHFYDTGSAMFEYYREHFAHVFSRLHNLKDVALRGCAGNIEDQHLSTLRAENLKTLEISGWEIKQLSVNISRFYNLQELTIGYMIIAQETVNNFHHLYHLTSLTLLECHVSAELLHKMCYLQSLKKLALIRTEQINDDHVAAIASSCLNLQSLILCELPNLTDFCFAEIARLPSLEFLLMAALPRVTDRSILHLRQVKILQLASCPGVTNEGLKRLILESNLSTLIVRYTGDKQTMIRDINQAILQRVSVEPFILDVGRYTGPPIPNLSPLLSLQEWVMMFT